MIIIPDKLRRPAEAEREELRKQLSEALTEIERLKGAVKTVQSAFKNYKNADAEAAKIVMREAKILAASCNSDSLNSERAANAMLTDEIERLNKNMQFAAAINLAMQESSYDMPDLRGHECLAKHKLLSLFDLWRKKVRPRLPGFIDDEISQRDKLIEQMRWALNWYKEQVSNCNRKGDIGETARDQLAKDVGKRAKAALRAADGDE